MDDLSKYTRGFQKFQNTVLALSGSFSQKRISENEKESIVITKNMLLNEKGPRRILKAPTAQEKIVSEITRGFSEIALSYYSIIEIPLYLTRYPGKLAYKSSYLEFVVDNYFNEVYILSERIKAYTKKIIRLYKNTPISTKLSNAISMLDEKMGEFFYNDNNIKRGRHVHVQRYKDDDLDRLIYLELLYVNANVSADKLITYEYKKALKYNKKKWLDFFEKKNKEYEGVIGLYFTFVYPIIFDKSGNFISPR